MAIPDFEPLAQGILNFVNWGITIITIMFIWEVIAFFFGVGTGSKAERSVGEFGKRISEKAKEASGWPFPKLKDEKKAHRLAQREKTTQLNDYVEEQNELKLLDAAISSTIKLTAVVNTAMTSGLKDKAPIEDGFDKVKKALKAAEKEISRLKRATFKNDRRTKQLITFLEDEGVADKGLKDMRNLEEDMFMKHEDVVKGLAGAQSKIDAAEKIVDVIKSAKKFPLTPASSVGTKPAKQLKDWLITLADLLKQANTSLDGAKTAQTKAYEHSKNLIAKFQELWKL